MKKFLTLYGNVHNYVVIALTNHNGTAPDPAALAGDFLTAPYVGTTILPAATSATDAFGNPRITFVSRFGACRMVIRFTPADTTPANYNTQVMSQQFTVRVAGGGVTSIAIPEGLLTLLPAINPTTTLTSPSTPTGDSAAGPDLDNPTLTVTLDTNLPTLP